MWGFGVGGLCSFWQERGWRMRVLIVSTAECAGGGAIAARRLMMALNKCGVQAKMLVRDKGTDSVTVARVGSARRRSSWPRWGWR